MGFCYYDNCWVSTFQRVANQVHSPNGYCKSFEELIFLLQMVYEDPATFCTYDKIIYFRIYLCYGCGLHFRYGDTAPRSVQARLYSILWMLLGMVAFSVLTANFTSSLAHEIEEDLSLHGKTVSILLRSS